ncbi:MAG: PHP domain-containing protein, partial [Roseinatronobacter sp.]
MPRIGAQGYAELCVTSNFTFLTGASHPEELVARAAELGLCAIAITDRNSLAGVVRAHVALRELGRAQAEAVSIRSHRQTDTSSRQTDTGAALSVPDGPLPRLIVGARLVLRDSAVEWLALPVCRAGYALLSRLLSLGKRRAPKGDCHLDHADLLAGGRDMILIALPPEQRTPGGEGQIRQIAANFPGNCFLGACPRYDGRDPERLALRAHQAAALAMPMVALGDVRMHSARRRKLADVLTCLRIGCDIDSLGARALANAESRLKSGREMARVFAPYPAALRRTLEIADRCAFNLDELSYEYPDEVTNGEPAQGRLERLVQEGVWRRFPTGAPPDTAAKVAKELRIISALGFASYFLTVHDIVAFARGRGILCQGRGSAANSVICYALGITEVPPDTISMVFERFMSEARGEPPDIDVDFEHE